MGPRVNIDAHMLTWAIERAGYERHEFFNEKMPTVRDWISGAKKPTFKQLEKFSKKVYLPVGYLFLSEPPAETLPIPFFRTEGNQAEEVGINTRDMILILQQRQDWLREYLQKNDFEPLAYVGAFRNNRDVNAVVASIRAALGLTEDWASRSQNWQEALKHLTKVIEDKGITVVFNSVVGSNNSRPIKVEACRGFVLVDDWAPFLFVNNADAKAAQMFTLVHELAHIWTGRSAGFDFRKLQPAADATEELCDAVAAEFLVPKAAFERQWCNNPDIAHAARRFKVSQIVIARRALDTAQISKAAFLQFYDAYKRKEFIKKTKTNSGEFYATAKRRIGISFAAHINTAVKTGQLLYRDAYNLTGMKGNTFEKFLAKTL